MKVFRDYTQAELELEYDSGARAPELVALREDRARVIDAEAARIRATAKAVLDLPYGTQQRERIDVYLPAEPKGALLAFIHGGYWRQRSKDEFAWMAPAFTEAGVTFAAIGYPLCPEVAIGDIVRSVERALMVLHGQAAALGFDPRRIHIAGHSAGAHLAAMAATTDFTELGGPAGLVTSATCVSGLYDLEPLRLVKINSDLKLGPEDIEPLSPVKLAAMPHVVVNLAVGGEEGAEFRRNTAELGAAWREIDIDVTEVAAPGRHHFDVLDELGRAGHPLHQRVMRCLLG